jgi:hypothetical protein
MLIDDFGFSIIRVRKGQKRVIPGEDWQTLQSLKKALQSAPNMADYPVS